MLSVDACARLLKKDDYPVLVSGPVVCIAALKEDDDKGKDLFGFIKAHVAELRDGSDKAVSVKFPKDLQVHGRLITAKGQAVDELKVDTNVKIQRMIRLPNGDILVHDVDIVDNSPPLQVSELSPASDVSPNAERAERLRTLWRPFMAEDQEFPDDELMRKIEDFVQGVLDMANEAQIDSQG